MINFAIYLLEFISVLLIIHLVFQSRFRMDFAAVLLFAVSMFSLFLAYFTQIQFITYVTQLAFYIYALYEFRKSWWETLLRVACSIAIIGILETIILVEINSWLETEEYSILVYVGINSCMLMGVGVFYWLFICKRINFNIDITDKTFLVLAFVINIFVMYTKDDSNSRIFRLIIFVVSFGLLVFRLIVITRRENRRVADETNSWMLQYKEQYETLIQTVRRRQHDYKNEIQTIKMACTVAGGTVAMDVIKEYEDAEQYTEILNGCENPVIAGLIYSKAEEFKEQGVMMACKINIRNIGLALNMRELIDIIGILLDNAFESTREQKTKTMYLEIGEIDKGLVIKTSNPSIYLSNEKISRMFALGYSTKGDKRGIGLHTVRELLKKCRGDIIVGNQTRSEQNYFDIQVIIPFNKKYVFES